MEAIILHKSDHFCMEPLNSYIDIFDLFIGNTSIWNETLSNLYRSGIKKVYFLVELYKYVKYAQLLRDGKFTMKGSKLKVEVVGLNVELEVGTALREFFGLHGRMEPFILLYSNTLLTVHLTEAIFFHKELARSNSNYSMTVLYVEDEKKRFSDLNNSTLVLFDDKHELLYTSNEDVLEFDSTFLDSVDFEQINIRYDLFQPCVYLCTNMIIELFMDLFDKTTMDELILELLTQEIKTIEVYMYVLKNDLTFPEYPSILRVDTPRDYYNVYTAYASRYFSETPGSSKSSSSTTASAASTDPKPVDKDFYGPSITKHSVFLNDSAFATLPLFDPSLNILPSKSKSADIHKLFESLNSSSSASIFGSSVRIGSNCIINNSVIFNNVVIGNNCTINNSIVMNNVIIEDNTTLVPGSFIGPCCRINQDTVSKSKCSKTLCNGDSTVAAVDSKSLICATMHTKFYDLTSETHELLNVNAKLADSDSNEHTEAEADVHVWPVESFITNPLRKIGSRFYDHLTFTMPESEEETLDYFGSDYDYRSDTESTSTYESGSYSEYSSAYATFDARWEDASEDFKVELEEMVHETLDDPQNLDNKILEIRSLRVAHNITERETLKHMYNYGMEWVISRFDKAKAPTLQNKRQNSNDSEEKHSDASSTEPAKPEPVEPNPPEPEPADEPKPQDEFSQEEESEEEGEYEEYSDETSAKPPDSELSPPEPVEPVPADVPKPHHEFSEEESEEDEESEDGDDEYEEVSTKPTVPEPETVPNQPPEPQETMASADPESESYESEEESDEETEEETEEDSKSSEEQVDTVQPEPVQTMAAAEPDDESYEEGESEEEDDEEYEDSKSSEEQAETPMPEPVQTIPADADEKSYEEDESEEEEDAEADVHEEQTTQPPEPEPVPNDEADAEPEDEESYEDDEYEDDEEESSEEENNPGTNVKDEVPEEQQIELVEDQIQQLIKIIELSLLNKLLDSFSIKLNPQLCYANTLSICNKLNKSQLFLCQIFEALYHTDVLDLVGFEKWVTDNNLKEDRLVSFAKWVES